MHEASGRRAGFESALALTSCATLCSTQMMLSGSNRVKDVHTAIRTVIYREGVSHSPPRANFRAAPHPKVLILPKL